MATAGFAWQDGPWILGLEVSAVTAAGGIGADDIPSPYFPNDQAFEVKDHWFATLIARGGFALDRAMLYIAAGVAPGHLIFGASDQAAGLAIRAGHWALGIAIGAGVEVALSERLALSLGYRSIRFPPLPVNGESVDLATGQPAGPATATDHTVRYAARALTAGSTIHFDEPDPIASQPRFSWQGLYAGLAYGSPTNTFITLGYNSVLASGLVGGIELGLGYFFCCGIGLRVETNGRIGFAPSSGLLLYGQAGLTFRAGAGLRLSVGGGLEITVGPRSSGFIELRRLGVPGRGFAEIDIAGGMRFHFSR
jgi:opacity protein-like surface antigen